MQVIKLHPMEADYMFPEGEDGELLPIETRELAAFDLILAELFANSGPYPEMARYELVDRVGALNASITEDQHGDECADVATCKVTFVDGTVEQFKVVCVM